MGRANITEAQAAGMGITGAKKQSKWKNRKVLNTPWGDFDSEKEFERFKLLQTLERLGYVRQIDRQQTYALMVNGILVCEYRADFVYETCLGNPTAETASEAVNKLDLNRWYRVVEDVKGCITAEFRIKKKLMKAVFQIDVAIWPPRKRKSRKSTNPPNRKRSIKR